jgi:hypothetical protein
MQRKILNFPIAYAFPEETAFGNAEFTTNRFASEPPLNAVLKSLIELADRFLNHHALGRTNLR